MKHCKPSIVPLDDVEVATSPLASPLRLRQLARQWLHGHPRRSEGRCCLARARAERLHAPILVRSLSLCRAPAFFARQLMERSSPSHSSPAVDCGSSGRTISIVDHSSPFSPHRRLCPPVPTASHPAPALASRTLLLRLPAEDPPCSRKASERRAGMVLQEGHAGGEVVCRLREAGCQGGRAR